MAEPVRNPDTGGRPLADILREAGIENPSRTGRRRRWDDMDDAGIRQRRADAARDEAAAAAPYGRRAGDLPLDRPEIDRSSGMPRVRDERFRRQQPADGRAEDRRRDDRPGREPGRESPRDAGRAPARDVSREPREPARQPAPDVARDPLRDTGRRTTARPEPPRPARAGEPSTAAIPGLRPSRTPAVPGATASTATVATPPSAAPAAPAAPAEEGPLEDRRRGKRRAGPAHSGPIPRVRPDDVVDGEAAAPPRESALAWVRFAGELVLAAAVGVGVYFAFTVLWEMVPHLAALASPLVVTGLVLGVSTWRQRSGRGQLGARLLGVLVFAGTVLTILPAAGLLSG